MEKFDYLIKKLGKGLWKIICIILQVIAYVVLWKIVYWAFGEFSRSPYGIVFEYNQKTDITERIPPKIFTYIKEVLPYDYTSLEYFCFFLACITLIMVFAIVHMPRIVKKLNKTRRVTSETIPHLMIILEAILIPILYYMHINKEISLWIIKDFIIVFVALEIFNLPNLFMSINYGWINYLIINLIIAFCFGTISLFFLYSLFEVLIVIIIVLFVLNLWIPIFDW